MDGVIRYGTKDYSIQDGLQDQELNQVLHVYRMVGRWNRVINNVRGGKYWEIMSQPGMEERMIGCYQDRQCDKGILLYKGGILLYKGLGLV